MFALVFEQLVQMKFGVAAAMAVPLFGVAIKKSQHSANCTVIGALLLVAMLLHHRG